MRKEVIFAIIIGLSLGVTILFGIRLANQSIITSSAPRNEAKIPSIPEGPTPAQVAGISIISPKNHSIINTATVKIIGKTLPNSTVAILSFENDILIISDSDGNFSADLELAGGENIIKATVLKPDQSMESTQISIIYTTAKIN